MTMVSHEAENGNYDGLTKLTGVPFIACNGSRPGSFGDHLVVSDGKEWHYSEALQESSYSAIRVETNGLVLADEMAEARKYWDVYSRAIPAIRSSGP